MLPMYLLSGCVIGLNVTVFDTGEIEVKEPNVDQVVDRPTAVKAVVRVEVKVAVRPMAVRPMVDKVADKTADKILLVQQQEVKQV